MVGRFVEQQDIGTLQQLRGQRQPHRFAATEAVQPPLQRELAQAQPRQQGLRALAQIPVAVQAFKVGVAAAAGENRVQRGQAVGDAKCLGHARPRRDGEMLRQPGQGALHLDGAGQRCKFAGDQPQQRALAGAVRRDQTGTAGAQHK